MALAGKNKSRSPVITSVGLRKEVSLSRGTAAGLMPVRECSAISGGGAGAPRRMGDMRLDPTDRFIRHITRACELDGRAVLEIGCGSGRITRDLASRAREVVAVDPDGGALDRARAQVAAGNVRFLRATAETLDVPGRTFDAAVFSLSLHHVPAGAMDASLVNAARHVRYGGRIVVIEPGDEGTLIDAETRFDVGDGDERPAKAAAERALRQLPGWTVVEQVRFTTLFHFQDEADFLEHLPPRGAPSGPDDALHAFLESHRRRDRIVLWAERRMTVLARTRA